MIYDTNCLPGLVYDFDTSVPENISVNNGKISQFKCRKSGAALVSNSVTDLAGCRVDSQTGKFAISKDVGVDYTPLKLTINPSLTKPELTIYNVFRPVNKGADDNSPGWDNADGILVELANADSSVQILNEFDPENFTRSQLTTKSDGVTRKIKVKGNQYEGNFSPHNIEGEPMIFSSSLRTDAHADGRIQTVYLNGRHRNTEDLSVILDLEDLTTLSIMSLQDGTDNMHEDFCFFQLLIFDTYHSHQQKVAMHKYLSKKWAVTSQPKGYFNE
tara:strand:+ start:897 stop:1715 length:819 start_codon:yes stop_codon:yes gene_type:complete